MRSTMEERHEITLGARVSKQLQAKILAEQHRIEKLTGIKPSINEVVRLLIERGLEANLKQNRLVGRK
jgi:hypothetical protein